MGGVVLDDIGAKRLIAEILSRAHEDYAEEHCPEWCPVLDTCDNKKDRPNQCDAKKFIHSAWCATLCEGIGIDHNDYVAVTAKKSSLNKDTFRHIESELRRYKESIRELERMKRDIIHEAAVNDGLGVSSYSVSDPSSSKAMKIINDKKIKRLETLIDAIKTVYCECDRGRQELVEMKYWDNRYKDNGIADALGISRATLYNWRDGIILKIAIKLGYL